MKTIILFFLVLNLSFSTTIKFSNLIINGKHREVNRKIIKKFESEYPGINVELLELGNDRYHKFIRLKQFMEYDVVWWFAGYQLKKFAENGLLLPVNNIFSEKDDVYGEQYSSISYDGNKYAVPISYYHWGIYYNKEIFDKYNIHPPETWKEFTEVCDKLKKNGIQPIGIGIKNNWTAAAWFSYLNLRINGLEFHLDLLEGKESFTDNKVEVVFDYWKDMLDKGYFSEQRENIDWKGTLPYMYRGIAAMTLIGNFASMQFSNKYYDKIGFFRFPVINKKIEIYEEAPTDVLFIPKSSLKKKEAKLFLEFMMRPDIQEEYNKVLGYLSPGSDSAEYEDYFMRKGHEILKNSGGFSQYFDRDTSTEMGEKGFKVFGDFMSDINKEKAINKLEKIKNEYLK